MRLLALTLLLPAFARASASAMPGFMGSLFAYSAARNGTRNGYGTSGNTYVAVVELGPKLRVRSIFPYGQSGDPASPHYFDQAPRYAEGKFKEAPFYREEVQQRAVRSYHPGHGAR
ncbi:penicillin acylase family protein [Flaviaesturariibacter amylovorans]|uniref:Uncharacterized protein n=1 Tax=Flaviaesturariibacter amylovorans TaxID=1084520 RepID=A0ABP8HU84_9BACT